MKKIFSRIKETPRGVLTGILIGIITFSVNISMAQMATNPIIYADVPDLSVIRVGDSYYMSSTTMHMNPGVPIMKSKDLVNWDLISYCYTSFENTDSYNLNNGKNDYGHGSWASSLRYHKGNFYVATFANTGRTYIYKTANIETGPWTVSVLPASYHDCSLFFDDDDRAYLIYGNGDMRIVELNSDATAIRPGGLNRVLISDPASIAGTGGLRAEGAQVQKVNGYYYVSMICWPSGSMRTQLVYRSTSIAGTYEGRVALRDQGVAQGAFIDTPTGKWYAYLFRDFGSVGRIPYLVPMTWSNGWPVLSPVPTTLDIPRGRGGLGNIVVSDEFGSTGPLQLAWQWNHNPKNNYWSLSQRPGFMRLTNERTDPNVLMTTNTLTQRAFGPKSTAYTSIDVSGMKDGDYAGLVALQKQYGYVGVRMTGNTKSIVMVTGDDVSGIPNQRASLPLNQNTVYLRIDMDFTNRTDKAYFYYSLNGTTWTAIGTTLQMAYTIPHFMGYRFGLFSYATQSSGGYADFDFFRVGTSVNNLIYSGPSVSFSSPLSGQTFITGDNITLTASASSPSGVVTSVQFYNRNTLLGTDNTAPYSYNWNGVPAGTYNLRAVVNDNEGNTGEAKITIRVNVPQSPYGGVAHKIPGTIQLEEFDLGGNGFAYYDATPGSEVSPVVNFRTDEDVDIETCTDAGGGYNIGWATAGEWLEYTVNVEAAGTYDLDLRVAVNGEGRTITVAMDGTSIASNVSIPNTSGWQSWQTVTVRNIELTTGIKVMRLTVGETDYVNLNYVSFRGVNVSLPPVVSLTAPSNNASYGSNETVRLSATASDPDGSVSKVDFYAGDLLIGSVTSAPYSLDWSRMNPGTYVLTAVATDNKGISTTSAPVSVTIRAVQAPFHGVAHMIPGRIEAEEYDLGGEGLGYHEANTNGNEGGAPFRNDEVDIEETGDDHGVYNVGYILSGEWLQYSVEVLASGIYDLNLRMASDGSGKTLHIEIDGVNVTGPVQVPNTGGWQTWETITVKDVNLTAGEHVMRIVFGSSYMNLNYVEFVDVVTGMDADVDRQIKVFPNPYKEVVYIVATKSITYKVFSITGEVVLSGDCFGKCIIDETLPSGIYFLSINSANGKETVKLVKE